MNDNQFDQPAGRKLLGHQTRGLGGWILNNIDVIDLCIVDGLPFISLIAGGQS